MFRSYEFKDASNSTNLSTFDYEFDQTQVDKSCGDQNPLNGPISSLMAMFVMSLNKFDETVCHFERTDHQILTVVSLLAFLRVLN